MSQTSKIAKAIKQIDAELFQTRRVIASWAAKTERLQNPPSMVNELNALKAKAQRLEMQRREWLQRLQQAQALHNAKLKQRVKIMQVIKNLQSELVETRRAIASWTTKTAANGYSPEMVRELNLLKAKWEDLKTKKQEWMRRLEALGTKSSSPSGLSAAAAAAAGGSNEHTSPRSQRLLLHTGGEGSSLNQVEQLKQFLDTTLHALPLSDSNQQFVLHVTNNRNKSWSFERYYSSDNGVEYKVFTTPKSMETAGGMSIDSRMWKENEIMFDAQKPMVSFSGVHILVSSVKRVVYHGQRWTAAGTLEQIPRKTLYDHTEQKLLMLRGQDYRYYEVKLAQDLPRAGASLYDVDQSGQRYAGEEDTVEDVENEQSFGGADTKEGGEMCSAQSMRGAAPFDCAAWSTSEQNATGHCAGRATTCPDGWHNEGCLCHKPTGFSFGL